MTAPLRKIIIAGGGTAGWMCAAALAVAVPKTVEILLIESEDIGTVGVGEATVPAIRAFNAQIGVHEGAFIRETQATFKLGIAFAGWGNETNRYFHGFSGFGAAYKGIAAYDLWRRAQASGEDMPLDALNLPTQMANAGVFAPPDPNPRLGLHDFNFAYHFDAGLYARFLRKHAEALGVKRLNARIADVALREDGGIASVTLDSGQVESGDFFLDCSGFRALLIEGAMKTGYVDWSHWLPVDRAWAVPCEPTGPLTPYTLSTATTGGWRWRIPLQHRTGNGHVYSSQFMDDDTARDTLMQHLDGKALKDPMLIRFLTGHRRKFWNNNCLCLGLASGFIEPLESTSINFIQNLINLFLEFYPSREPAPVVEAEFNRLVLNEYERTRDFIILHYHLNSRHDGELWRYCADMDIPDSLKERIDLFRATGHIVPYERESFQPESWLAIFNGHGVVTNGYNRLCERLPQTEVIAELRRRRDQIAATVARLPSHAAFIAAHCAAPLVNA